MVKGMSTRSVISRARGLYPTLFPGEVGREWRFIKRPCIKDFLALADSQPASSVTAPHSAFFHYLYRVRLKR